MTRSLVVFTLVSSALYGQYKLEPAGAPPAEVSPAIAAELQKTGHRILSPDGKPAMEVWFRNQVPKGAVTSEVEVMWKTVPHGSLIGVVRYVAKGGDRRDQQIKPGLYTMRFSYYPVSGDHIGVAPNRDFLVLSSASGDSSLEPVTAFPALMDMSRKASGTPHPLVLSMFAGEGDFKPGLTHPNDDDWVLQSTVGDLKIGLILVGAGGH